MPPQNLPSGDKAREAIDSLRGYVYQIYQSALAWTELDEDEFLLLEIAEDYAIAANDALQAVQVKDTAGNVTINSNDIVTSIDSFVELQKRNPSLKVTLRHLTTSTIGKEKKREDRVGDAPTLDAWRRLAKSGDLTELRRVLRASKLAQQTKAYIDGLDDCDLRERFLKRIHFDCGAPESRFLDRQVNSKISKLLLERGGTHSQVQACKASMLLSVLVLCTNSDRDERFIDRNGLDELLERATHVILNRAQFEMQNELMNKALSASVSIEANLSNATFIRPSSVSETPLPKALANRTEAIGRLQAILDTCGLCWISGAAGMGKTVASRILAHDNVGRWTALNLRGQSREQVAQALFQSADSMTNFGLRGLIVDDIAWITDPNVLDGLSYLTFASRRSDVLLVFNSSDTPSNELLFTIQLPSSISYRLSEFSRDDIRSILVGLEVNESKWVEYTFMISGGGHPQLAMAFLQSMAASGWNPSEFQTLDALLQGSPAVEDVRKRTRERLLNDLPQSSRQLLERLSLKAGSFSRKLAIDLGKVEPAIADVGIILETLIGSWVDQQEGTRFSLSPLLSGFAAKTLGDDDQKRLESAIAVSLTTGRSLDVLDMNSAFLAAWASENEGALLKLCLAVIGSDISELEMLAPHLSAFTLFRTDTTAYPANAFLSHIFRGAQVLLINQVADSPIDIRDALRCFADEGSKVENDEMRAAMNLLVHSKLLLQTSMAGLGADFTTVLQEMDHVIESGILPLDVQKGARELEKEGVTAIGFMFINQARQLENIDDLTSVFDFLNDASPVLRSKLLSTFGHDDFDVDMLLSAAWLREHERGSIVPLVHSQTFARLEEQATTWDEIDLAVCCCKYQAIILDEYGGDKDGALSVLGRGLAKFGQTNSVLVRAKAKVLHRSDDHKGSLELSKKLIDGNAPLSEVEKAFLGRDAAISAESQGDFKLARRYFLYGSVAARNSNEPDLTAMRVGLLADAALASWHDGDRISCLHDFAAVLGELNQFSPDQTLRTAHCHAVVRHALLWLDQEATGEKRLLRDGEETKIYPGCVSNPEPHSKIGERYISPIEIAWYMLATVENHALVNAGVTENLDRFLPNGPVFEGQVLLAPAKMHRALALSDTDYFVTALRETISYLSFLKANGGPAMCLDIENVTYDKFPAPSKEQQNELGELTEQFVLTYLAICMFKGEYDRFASLIGKITGANGFYIRPLLLEHLEKGGAANDFNTTFAILLRGFAQRAMEKRMSSPRQVFEVALRFLQLAKETSNYRLAAQALLPWLEERWSFICTQQRFLLNRPSLHEAGIIYAISDDGASDERRVVSILTAALPTLGIENHGDIERILAALPR